jgi:hypothetical protein
MRTNSNTGVVPLERFAATGQVPWARVSREDQRILFHWMSAHDPNFKPAMAQLAAMFNAEPLGFEVHKAFWPWLTDVRAWQAERVAGGVRPIPAVPKPPHRTTV